MSLNPSQRLKRRRSSLEDLKQRQTGGAGFVDELRREALECQLHALRPVRLICLGRDNSRTDALHDELVGAEKALRLALEVLIESLGRYSSQRRKPSQRHSLVALLADELDHRALDAGALVDGNLGGRAARSWAQLPVARGVECGSVHPVSGAARPESPSARWERRLPAPAPCS